MSTQNCLPGERSEVRSCKLEETVFISLFLKQHPSISHTWPGKEGANICIHFKLVNEPGTRAERMQGHPSNSKSEVHGPWHAGSKRMRVSLPGQRIPHAPSTRENLARGAWHLHPWKWHHVEAAPGGRLSRCSSEEASVLPPGTGEKRREAGVGGPTHREVTGEFRQRSRAAYP